MEEMRTFGLKAGGMKAYGGCFRLLPICLLVFVLAACRTRAELTSASDPSLTSERPTETLIAPTKPPEPTELSPAGGDEGLPILEITFPTSGATVTQPVPICYRILGLEVSSSAPRRLLVLIGTPPTVSHEFLIEEPSGAIFLQDDKFLSGRRDLTVQLKDGEGDLPEGSLIEAVISDVIIEGDRAAGASSTIQCP